MEIKIKRNSNNNPFYGMKSLLHLNKASNVMISESEIDEAYLETGDDKDKLKLFYSVLFSIGDITARQHNIFHGVQKDSGGNANRIAFPIAIDWMWKNQREQFIKFLNAGLFNEYTCFDHLLNNRITTKNGKITSVSKRLHDAEYRKVIVDYLYKVINGTNSFNKLLVAKFLTLPRLTKRSGHNKMLDTTLQNMKYKCNILEELSKLMHWDYVLTDKIANFKGYRAWRKNFNSNLESVVFSTHKCNDFDKYTFTEWVNELPAKARERVRNRLKTSRDKDGKEKYPLMKQWFQEWEEYKEKMQEEKRELEEKIRQGLASEDEKKKLVDVSKEAKVTIGANSFTQIFNDISNENVDELKIQSFVDKVNLPYNSLVIMDMSGSMSGRPIEQAIFIASLCLYKNPDDSARSLIGMFNYKTKWVTSISAKTVNRKNSLLNHESVDVTNKPFIEPNKSFVENYKNIRDFILATFEGGGTNISSIAESLAVMAKNSPEIIDSLKEYPVWTIISDGEWNNLSTPKKSMEDFLNKCETYLGFKPFIIAIDVAEGWCNSSNIDEFSDIENMIYINNNIAQIETFLTHFKDMEAFDVYTPLLSLYRSNRYELVRQNVL
jgi:hypothetical protein